MVAARDTEMGATAVVPHPPRLPTSELVDEEETRVWFKPLHPGSLLPQLQRLPNSHICGSVDQSSAEQEEKYKMMPSRRLLLIATGWVW